MITLLHFSISFFISSFIFLLFLNKSLSFIFSILVASLSTIPDFDVKIYSYSTKKILILKNKKYLKYVLFPYYLLLIFLQSIFKHRGITHSIFFPTIIFLLSRIQPFIFIRIAGYLLSFGIILHIFQDIFTISGVQIFYPISKKSFKIPIINTRKDIFLQKILSLAFLLIAILLYILY